MRGSQKKLSKRSTVESLVIGFFKVVNDANKLRWNTIKFSIEETAAGFQKLFMIDLRKPEKFSKKFKKFGDRRRTDAKRLVDEDSNLTRFVIGKFFQLLKDILEIFD